ncbi:MAG: glycosyltransferase family 39 protein [Actinomycetota bacterium]|nr:glycosyltransferase family 39 protein [Actinomycetota bacterium]
MPATTTIPDDTGAAEVRRTFRWSDMVALVTLALLVRIPAYFAPRALSFDDGVFSNSAVAMRAGGVPFRDVFSSQGPLFLPLVWLGDLVGFRTMDSPRVLAVVSGLVIVAAVYWTAAQMTDRCGALVAGALAATSGGLAWVTVSLAADGPALAFATLAVGLSVRQRNRPTTWGAVLIGLAVGATLSTKAMEAPVLVPVVLVLLAPLVADLRSRRSPTRSLLRGVVAALSAGAVFLAVSIPLGMTEVWDQSVRYRTDAAAQRDVLGNAAKLFSTLWDRDLAVLFFAVVALVAGVVARRSTGRAATTVGALEGAAGTDGTATDASWWSRRDWAGRDWAPSDRLLVTSWVVVSALWLIVVVSPLWRPHVAAMAPPLVLLIGLYRPPWKLAVVAGVIAVPMAVVQLDGLLAPAEYSGTEAEILAELRQLPRDAWVISDEPGVVWRAGLRTTDDLVDPSMLRRQQERYTEQSLIDDASDPRICAVVAISEQRFGHFGGLAEGLATEGFEPVAGVGDGSVLFVRQDCSAGS